jgi:hypothetical protein
MGVYIGAKGWFHHLRRSSSVEVDGRQPPHGRPTMQCGDTASLASESPLPHPRERTHHVWTKTGLSHGQLAIRVSNRPAIELVGAGLRSVLFRSHLVRSGLW